MDHIEWEEACSMLCLLTRTAWNPDLPSLLSRPAVHQLIQRGVLKSLILREVPETDSRLCEHARKLLTRTKEAAFRLENYLEQGYSILIPNQEEWPKALNVLGPHEPLFLFARGNLSLLKENKIAIAGSRNITAPTVQMAQRTGQMLAQEGFVMVSGGARGIDRFTQEALLEAGGSLVLVPAVTDQDILRNMAVRQALEEGRLLLLCDTVPDEPFSVRKALNRNHTIYALGKAALVLASQSGRGGSWRGAVDCMHGHFSPVYVPIDHSTDNLGNMALLALGARRIDLSGKTSLSAQLDFESN